MSHVLWPIFSTALFSGLVTQKFHLTVVVFTSASAFECFKVHCSCFCAIFLRRYRNASGKNCLEPIAIPIGNGAELLKCVDGFSRPSQRLSSLQQRQIRLNEIAVGEVSPFAPIQTMD